MRLHRPASARWVVVLLLTLASAGLAQAQDTYRWSGNANDGLWRTQSNWVWTPSPIDPIAPPPNTPNGTVLFNNLFNSSSSTNISLNGGFLNPSNSWALLSLQFDTAGVPSYNIGGGGFGTLQFTAGGDISIANTVTNSQTISGGIQALGALSVNNLSATAGLNLSGAISGGAFTKTGVGTVILSGTNTHTTTTITGGTLQIGNGGATGSFGSGLVTNNAALVFNQNNSYTVGNLISGTGTLTQAGSGTTVLTNAGNTYLGATTISAGTLSIAADTNLGTAPLTATPGHLTINAGGTLATTANLTLNANRGIALTGNGLASVSVASGTALNYGGIIDGTASTSLTKVGTGTLELSGTNTYTGATTVAAGTLSIAADTNLGTAPAAPTAGHLTINAGGTLATTASFNLNTNRGLALTGTGDATINVTTGSLEYNGVIAGGAGSTLAKTGAGTLALYGNNTYAGATTITAGILQVGGGTASGSLGTGDVTNNAALVFNRSDTAVVANAISGIGSVIQAGGGTTILTGANSYAGVTTISNGVLQVGNGGTSGSLGVDGVTNNTFLVFNRSDTVTVANNISGGGEVRQNGTGTTILSGTNTYTGGTNVNAGALVVSGNSSGATGTTTVFSNATLAGTGSLGGTTSVNSGGTLHGGTPGGIGTLTLGGPLTMGSGSKLSLRVNGVAGPEGAAGTGGSSTGTNNNRVAITTGGANLSGLTADDIFVDVSGTTGFTWNVSQSYLVMTGAGDQTGLNIIGFTINGLPLEGNTFEAINVSLTGNEFGNVYLNFVPVPEPATVFAVGAGVLGLGGMVRRRMKKGQATPAETPVVA